MNRRSFLTQIGSLAFASQIKSAEANTTNKSVVFLFLSGGMSHQDSFIVKPDTIDAQKPVNGYINTNIPGIFLGANFTNIARQINKIRLVHSFSHNNSGHAGGSHWVLTGHDNRSVDNGGQQDKPSYGSINSRYKGVVNDLGLPNYVKTSSHIGDNAGWLGKQFNPFDINGQGRNNITLNINRDIFNQRRELLQAFDNFRQSTFGEQAYSLMLSNANEVFDISKESMGVRNRYGSSRIGQDLLLARRLVEKGVGYVSLVHGGWDMHSNIRDGYNRIAGEIDIGISAFIEDIYARGLQDNVLLVVAGEFGRTMLNNTAGRDHYAMLSPLLLSGGSIDRGGIYGKCSSRLTEPVENLMTPQDLSATILNFLEIPNNLTYQDQSGRPQYMTTGTPIRYN